MTNDAKLATATRSLTKDTLEQAIDTYSLEFVINLIGEICAEKSDHIMTNWQDDGLARNWDAATHRLFTLAAWCHKQAPGLAS